MSSLARRIDEHVHALNTARRDLAERIVRLDAVVEAAGDPQLERFLRTRSRVTLPHQVETFPDRLYLAD